MCDDVNGNVAVCLSRISPGLFSYIVTLQLSAQVVFCILNSDNPVIVCGARNVVSVSVHIHCTFSGC